MSHTDEDLETMKPSALVRLMVEHAKAFDARVQLHPDTFGWNMGTWLSHADHDPQHRRDWPECVACLAGAMLHARGDKFRVERPWMCRVDALRTGSVATAVEDAYYRQHVKEIGDLHVWFRLHRPADSAAHGDAWNSEDDEGFYESFADMLEEAGL